MTALRSRRAQVRWICQVLSAAAALLALAQGVVACGEEADGTTPVCDDPGGPADDTAGNAGAPAFRTGSPDCFTPLQQVTDAGGSAGTSAQAGAGGSDAGAGGSDAGAAGSDAGAGGSDAGAGGSDAGAAGSDAGAAGSS